MPFGSICCTYHQLKYWSPNRSKKQKQRATQTSLPFRKAEKGQTERATGQDRRTREEINIEKWDQTNNLEIPDNGRHRKSLASLHGKPLETRMSSRGRPLIWYQLATVKWVNEPLKREWCLYCPGSCFPSSELPTHEYTCQ